MKNFNELFTETCQVADHRKKIFNQLITSTSTEILPKFCEACESYDLQTVFFKTRKRIFIDQEHHEVEQDYAISCLALNVVEKTISDGTFNFFENTIESNYENVPISEVGFTRTGIVEFVNAIYSRWADYNRVYASLNEEVKELNQSFRVEPKN